MNDLRLEVSVDTQLAEVYEAYYLARIEKQRAEDTIQHLNKTKKIHTSRYNYRWEVPVEEAIARIEQQISDGTFFPVYQRDFERAMARRQQSIDEQARIFEVDQELKDIFREFGPWNRFFLVPGGHIHSSMECHSCYETTRFSWLPTLSGLTEEVAVTEHGTILCTHCFPSAPVEWTANKHGEKKRPDDYYCPGSGEAPKIEEYRRVGFDGTERQDVRYRCSVCNDRLTPYGYSGAEITTRGLVRKHRAKAKPAQSK